MCPEREQFGGFWLVSEETQTDNIFASSQNFLLRCHSTDSF